MADPRVMPLWRVRNRITSMQHQITLLADAIDEGGYPAIADELRAGIEPVFEEINSKLTHTQALREEVKFQHDE